VSTSFKKLQAERSAVDDVVRELTPLEDADDATVLRDYLTNLNMKTEVTCHNVYPVLASYPSE
jgi:hypothetical protein